MHHVGRMLPGSHRQRIANLVQRERVGLSGIGHRGEGNELGLNRWLGA